MYISPSKYFRNETLHSLIVATLGKPQSAEVVDEYVANMRKQLAPSSSTEMQIALNVAERFGLEAVEDLIYRQVKKERKANKRKKVANGLS